MAEVDFQDGLDFKVSKEDLEILDFRVKMDGPDDRVIQGIKEFLASEDHQEEVVTQVKWATEDSMGPLDFVVILDRLVS